MAIYHCSVKVIGRGGGKSAVASAAYRSGEKLINEYDGFTHDYTKKSGIVHTEIMAPDNAPEWTKERSKLWNAVELSEKRKDAQLSREVELALPKELSLEKQKTLLGNYCNENFVSKGMIADVSIHDKGDGNPHAHIMLTLRPVDENGFAAKKDRSWNDKWALESWRVEWEKAVNWHLDKKQHISHKSCDDMDSYRLPTKHLGPYAASLEKKGITTEIGDYNRRISSINASMDKEISNCEGVLIALIVEKHAQASKEQEKRRQEEERIEKEKLEREKQKTLEEKRTELTQEQKNLISGISEQEKSISTLRDEISSLKSKKDTISTRGEEQLIFVATNHYKELERIEKERKKLGFFDFGGRSELNTEEKTEYAKWNQVKKTLSMKKDFNAEDLRILEERISTKRDQAGVIQDKINELQGKIDDLEAEKAVLIWKKTEVERELDKLKSPEKIAQEVEKDIQKVRERSKGYER